MPSELPLLRAEARVILPGVTAALPVASPRSRRAVELAAASPERRIVAVLAYPDGIAPIGTVCRVVEDAGERVVLAAESRARIHFVRGDLAHVEPYADTELEFDPAAADRARSKLMAHATAGNRIPGDVIERVALTGDPELLANLVLTYTQAPLSKLQRALELTSAAARLALCS